MCQEVGDEVVRQLRRLHSADFALVRSVVAGSVFVTGLSELASSITSEVRVQVRAAASVITSCKTTFPAHSDAALSARLTCQTCVTVAPEAIVPIASAPVGATVTVAPAGADRTLRVAVTPPASAQPAFLRPIVSVAVSRRSRKPSPSQPPDRAEEATSMNGTPAAPRFEATRAKS